MTANPTAPNLAPVGWQRAPGVVYAVVDGQAMLVDPDGLELVTLNRVGTLVWEELDADRGAPELSAALIGHFDDVTQDQLEHDIALFIDELQAAALIVRGDTG